MNKLIVPVVLAGGQGSRLWPLSRTARPKQFLPLTGVESLFQETLRRVADPERYGPVLVLTHDDYRFLVAEQVLQVEARSAGVLLEPVMRNTAAAITAAALYAVNHIDPNAVLHVLPSDHAVLANEAYWQAIALAADEARAGRLVTFGISPLGPETGYGYIQAGAPIGNGLFEVARFTEKPRRDAAQRMIASGGYSWNSGMFMLGAQTFLDECRILAGEVYSAATSAVELAKPDLDFIRLDAQALAKAPDISVDYAIFEKTRLATVLPVDFQWSDMGAWDAVWKVSGKDAAGNVGKGPVTFSDTLNSLVVSDRAHVAVDGLDDVVVIASEDAVFVGRLSEAQKVGAMVKVLRQRPETLALTESHKTSYRPWGGYSSVLDGERFQVKWLFVKPGKKLSLQMHHHRSEHWIVVRGTAEVTIDGKVQMVAENQSVYLPVGCRHRLANPGKILLELVEVQTGSYLGEDDIIRLEDEFGRS